LFELRRNLITFKFNPHWL